MREKLKLAGKAAAFACLLGLMVYGINRTLTPKYRYNCTNPLTETYRGFYRMEKDTVDVLFLGSSQAAAGFNPQNLYDEFGIRSYNLGSNHQSLWISYYWLKEALKYQSPKAVVLDCYELYIDGRKYESNARLALDDMRWGLVKMEAVDTVCGFDESQSRHGYLLTNIRFHTRWSQLNENDFTWMHMASVPELKGFWLYRDICAYEDFKPFKAQPSQEEQFLPEPGEYLDNIRKLCNQEGIDLILVKTPTLAQSLERHNAIMSYTKINDMDFIDFNEIETYTEAGLDYKTDMNDSRETGDKNAHANPAGARKMTRYIGQILRNNHCVESHEDMQWEKTKKFNDGIWNDFLLHNETDLRSYLASLKDERYTVFLAIKGSGTELERQEYKSLMKNLGLDFSWQENGGKSYYAVIENGTVRQEQGGGGRLSKLGAFRKGQVIYQISSAGQDWGNDCSIQIDGKEQSKKQQGLNIVVYSNDTKSVIDSVCFDVENQELTASR